MGLLWAGAGITAGVGAMLAGHWGSIHRERRFMVLGFLASAAAILDVTLLPNLPMLAAGFAFIGLVSGPIDVAVLSLRQRGTDPAWLSRVLAVSISLNTCGWPLGSALAGILVTRFR